MQLYQPLSGYCFNSDTLFLYDFAMRFISKGSVLEIGSGCGVLGLLLARDLPIELTQIEKQSQFAAYTAKNAQVNAIATHIVEKDFLDFHSDETFDAIVTNPPFYHDDVVKTQDPMLHTARYSQHLPPQAFITKASSMLKPRGRLLFCYDPQILPTLFVALHGASLTVEAIRFVHPVENKAASLVMIYARKGSKSLLKTLPPLIAMEHGIYSKAAQTIFDAARTRSIKCEIA